MFSILQPQLIHRKIRTAKLSVKKFQNEFRLNPRASFMECGGKRSDNTAFPTRAEQTKNSLTQIPRISRNFHELNSLSRQFAKSA